MPFRLLSTAFTAGCEIPVEYTCKDKGLSRSLNDWKRTGYSVLCPPIGWHRYFHKPHALDTRLVHIARPA